MTDYDLDGFLAAYAEDDNEWWRLETGQMQNLFEDAVDRLRAERADREIADAALETYDQALWDIYTASGADTDGDTDGKACIAGMGRDRYALMVLEAVCELAEDDGSSTEPAVQWETACAVWRKRALDAEAALLDVPGVDTATRDQP